MISGNHGIQQGILSLLSQLTNIDGFDYVQVWGVGYKYEIIHPTREISDDVLGELYGMMLARLTSNIFKLHNIKVEELQKRIEKLGKLNKKLEVHSREISRDKLYSQIRTEETEDEPVDRQEKTYQVNFTYIPQQVLNLIDSVNLQESTPEFALHALRGYAMLRGYKRSGGHELYIPIREESIVRNLGTIAGVSISEGSHVGKLKIVRMTV